MFEALFHLLAHPLERESLSRVMENRPGIIVAHPRVRGQPGIIEVHLESQMLTIDL
jgi:hypothetical protein